MVRDAVGDDRARLKAELKAELRTELEAEILQGVLAKLADMRMRKTDRGENHEVDQTPVGTVTDDEQFYDTQEGNEEEA